MKRNGHNFERIYDILAWMPENRVFNLTLPDYLGLPRRFWFAKFGNLDWFMFVLSAQPCLTFCNLPSFCAYLY